MMVKEEEDVIYITEVYLQGICSKQQLRGSEEEQDKLEVRAGFFPGFIVLSKTKIGIH